jgi:hypothetical protein
VFFIDDSHDPDVQVVLRHEPRGKRTTEENDTPFFGAYGAEDGELVIPVFNHGLGLVGEAIPVPHKPAVGKTVLQG